MLPPCFLLLAADPWAVTKPDLWVALGLGLLVTAGLTWTALHLRESAPAAPPPGFEPPWLAPEVARVEAARARIGEALRAGRGSGAHLASEALLEGPLTKCLQRIAALASVARAHGCAPEDPRHEVERRRLAGSLASEAHPRAQALLCAALGDLDQAAAARRARLERARLAQLEFVRLRALLDSLPEQIQDLQARDLLGEGADSAEAIAQLLNRAVAETAQLLADVPLSSQGPSL